MPECMKEDKFPPVDTQVWYEWECSRMGADDWFATSPLSHTTVEGLKATREYILGDEEFDYRIVRKTLTTEVVE